MANTNRCNYFHISFSTSGRTKSISEELQPQLWRMMAGIAKKEGWRAVAVGGMEEHAHLLLNLPPVVSVSKAVQVIKSNSSRWMRTKVKGFAWQQGYGCFTVSKSGIEAVREYIEHQKEHHRKRTFEDEYLALLKKHGVEYDPKYVFD